MKIAVLFFGQPRQIEKAAQFIKPFFDLSSHNISTDYFIHTWTLSDPKDVNKCYNVGNEKQISLSPDTLEASLKEIYNPVSVSIDDPIENSFFTSEAEKFVELWHAIPQTSSFQKTESAHSFLSHNSLVKYKIGQLVSSEKVIGLKKSHENARGFTYDCVFRIRLDMAFKPSPPEDRLGFLLSGFNRAKSTPADINPIYVDYLKIARGFPQCGDQFIWGPSLALDKLFTGITTSFYNYVKKFFINCSNGTYDQHLNIITEFLHIETAVAQAALDHGCSVIPLSPYKGAGAFSLVRDTVNPNDPYDKIHQKHCQFFNS